METRTQTVVSHVEVPVKISGWKKFWMRLDGNKSMILSMIATTVSLVPIGEPYKTIALSLLGLLGAKTLYNYTQNGGFKPSIKNIIIE